MIDIVWAVHFESSSELNSLQEYVSNLGIIPTELSVCLIKERWLAPRLKAEFCLFVCLNWSWSLKVGYFLPDNLRITYFNCLYTVCWFYSPVTCSFVPHEQAWHGDWPHLPSHLSPHTYIHFYKTAESKPFSLDLSKLGDFTIIKKQKNHLKISLKCTYLLAVTRVLWISPQWPFSIVSEREEQKCLFYIILVSMPQC